MPQYTDIPDRRKDSASERARKNRGYRTWLRERKRERRARSHIDMLRPERILSHVRTAEVKFYEFDTADLSGVAGAEIKIINPDEAFAPPFRCEQDKSSDGWRVLDANDKVAGKARSRRGQRKLRDELNGEA